jgi:hypothetical protein
MPEVRVTVLPGESLAVAFLEYCTKVRETMSQPNRDKADEVGLRFIDLLTKMWGKPE